MAERAAPKGSGNFQFHWTSNRLYTPKRKDLFLVQIGGKNTAGDVGLGFGINGDSPDGEVDKFPGPDTTNNGITWYCKSVKKPKLTMNPAQEGVDGVRIYGQDGYLMRELDKVTIENVDMTLIDPVYPNSTRSLLRLLREGGYDGASTISSDQLASIIGDVKIKQFSTLPNKGSELYLLEEWTLHTPLITSINFGDLDYSSSDFVELNISFAPLGISAEIHGTGNGDTALNYFKDDAIQASIAIWESMQQ